MLSLIIPFIVGIFLIWIPGLIVMFGFFRKDDLVAYAAAPYISVFLYSIIGEIFTHFGIFCSWVSVGITALLLSIVSAFIFKIARHLLRKRQTGKHEKASIEAALKVARKDCLIFALYPFMGAVLVFAIYFESLYSPDSVAALFDNMHHVDTIQGFVDSGQWKFLDVDSKYSSSGRVAPFGDSEGFYPTAWHLLCAMLCELCSISPMAAANIVNGLFIGAVFPCAMYSLINVLFKNDRRILICGSFVSLGFAIFPWQFLIWGPLYPNLSSMALFPAVSAFFLRVFRCEGRVGSRIKNGFVFTLGLGALIVSQTNAVFCMAVLFIPYVIYVCSQTPKRAFNKNKPCLTIIAGVLACVLIACIWMFFYNLDALQPTVQYQWPATRSLVKALLGVAVSGFSMVTPPQILLSLFIFIGIVYMLRYKKNRWLIFSYLFAALIYVVCASSEGELKHILGGFWYTDTFRIAAMTVVFAIPMASAGLLYAIQLIWKLVERFKLSDKKLRVCQTAVAFFVIAVSVYMIYGPSAPINRAMGQQSAFNCITGALRDLYGSGEGTPLDDKERAFLDEVKEIVGDSVVVNVADDGSGMAYATDGINVYYRSPIGYGDPSEIEQSVTIRNALNEVATNPEVKQALDDIGAKYLLFLDHGQTDLSANNHYITVHIPEAWVGMEAVGEDTDGFELLLHEDDMYLYKID